MTSPLLLIGCRPVVWPTGELGDQPSHIYADSTVDDCQYCDRKVYVGPRQRAVIADKPMEAVIICFVCALPAVAVGMDVESLGNPG